MVELVWADEISPAPIASRQSNTARKMNLASPNTPDSIFASG
jgi:hypothetical protein